MAVGLPRGCGHSQQPDEPGQVVLISRRGQGVHAFKGMCMCMYVYDCASVCTCKQVCKQPS
eukprot:1151181-Pelagomonas_calceolata.AAC.5